MTTERPSPTEVPRELRNPEIVALEDRVERLEQFLVELLERTRINHDLLSRDLLDSLQYSMREGT
jgi:hypothetical protein